MEEGLEEGLEVGGKYVGSRLDIVDKLLNPHLILFRDNSIDQLIGGYVEAQPIAS